MARSKAAHASAGIVSLLGILVFGCAITVLCINRYQLYSVSTWCGYWSGSWYVQCYAVSNSCWFSEDPLSEFTACRYLYALGSVALFLELSISLTACVSHGAAIGCMAVSGLCNVGWWLAGAIYFTNQVKLVKDTDIAGQSIPAGSYRIGMEAVCWAAFSVSVIQLLAMFMVWKTMKAEKHMAAVEQEAQKQEMGDYPPAQPAYGAPPPPSANYYPPPAPAGYPPVPAGYPPAPAGYPPAPAKEGYAA